MAVSPAVASADRAYQASLPSVQPSMSPLRRKGGVPTLTADDLRSFEREMADLFEAGRIKAPLHLAGGNEGYLIEIFQDIAPEDWVLCSWRSHYHCLLKGVPRETVKAAILEGRSIALCFPEHRLLSSAIVAGILPIGLGLAWAAKGSGVKVHCFIGDMTVETGIAHECMKYAAGHDLPIRFIVEDNGLSVCTDTQEVWGHNRMDGLPEIVRYSYKLAWPHVGIGKFVRF